MAKVLSRLFRPNSIAVFGGNWAAAVVEQCQRMGFSGEVWPVHPTRAEVHGRHCFRSVEELPAAPDAAFIGVNRQLTLEIVGALAARGAGGAVCFASGFLESENEIAGGAALQTGLLEAAGTMPVLGPNCYGFVNYLDGALLWPDQHGGKRVERGVAIVTQSSNIAINMTMQRRGLPLAYLVTAGNQAQTGLAEIAAGLIEDPRVTALGLYVEGFGDLRAFEALAAQARALGKPIVAIKVGRSGQARSTAASHTASLTGEDAGAGAFLARLGIARLDSVSAFLEALKLLHVHGPLAGDRIASMSCSGGEASLVADTSLGRKLALRPLSETGKAAVKATLGPLVTVANPLDYHTFIWNDRPAMTATFTAMLGDGFDLGVLTLDFPREDRCDEASWLNAVEALADASSASGVPVAIMALMAENLPERWAEALIARAIAPLAGLEVSLAAIEAAAAIGKAWRGPAPTPVLLAASPTGGADRILSEAEAKTALASAGLPVPTSRTAASPDEAARAASDLGFPVVLKGLGIAHKTEAGAVRVGLGDEVAVRQAAREMTETVEGFLVERMIEGALAELLVGVIRDPAHGFVLTLGAGGILTEILEDTACLLLPVGAGEIRAALRGLRVWPLLAGYRGKPPADLEALVAAALAVTAFVEAQAETLLELDVNPLLALPCGTVAVDALVRLRG